jgi:hypothetical protein
MHASCPYCGYVLILEEDDCGQQSSYNLVSQAISMDTRKNVRAGRAARR